MEYMLLRKVADYFKKSDLIPYPLSVQRTKLKDDGQCEFKNKKFFIKINRELPENHSIDVLIHELAHAAAWDKDVDIHGPNWGKTYSKIYRMFLENFIKEQ